MRKASPLICKKYKSPVFHNTEDLNQLKSYKDYTLKGFVCKGNELFLINEIICEKFSAINYH